MREVIDELVADGEAAADKAARGAEEAADRTKASIKEAAAASDDKLASTGAEGKSTVDAAVADAAVDVEAAKEEINRLGEQAAAAATKAEEIVQQEVKEATDVPKAEAGSSQEL